jgi:hypothetical protein
MSDVSGTPAPVDYTMTAYVAADATGAIQYTGIIPQFMIAAQVPPAGGAIVLGTGNAATDYVASGVITPRPANPTTLSGMQLSSIPNPSTVTIAGGSPTTVTDGEVELSFTQPGTYDVKVSSWPMLDADFSVTQS